MTFEINTGKVQKCLITYGLLDDTESLYSRSGLKSLSASLQNLAILPFDKSDLLLEAASRAPIMSIQGVQPKLSAILKTKAGYFQIVDTGGRFILKPPHPVYPELPENEDLSMKLARLIGLEVPGHGLLKMKDGNYCYFIRRFDRFGHNQKLHVEDFAQLSGASRDTKYNSSMEKAAQIVERYCSFPVLEKEKLFKMTLFSWLIGNEDMHLKNFSIINRKGVIKLAPVYDLLATSLVLKNPEEMALPLNGKRNKLERHDIVEYFASERLGLPESVVAKNLKIFRNHKQDFLNMITSSFLSDEFRQSYKDLYLSRYETLFAD